MEEELGERRYRRLPANSQRIRRGLTKQERMGIEHFLRNNFTEHGEFYIPKDSTLNKYRHFGTRTKDGLCMRYEEVLFIYSSECHDDRLRTRAYFDLKNEGFNILFDHNMALYVRTKHFNRLKEKPLGRLEYVHMDQDVLRLCKDDVIAVVLGCDDYCFLSIRALDELSHERFESHRKCRADGAHHLD